jgi:hypothetical protein
VLTDLLTVAVLLWIGSRILTATTIALRTRRAHVAWLLRGLRVRHFLRALVVLPAVLVAVYALISVPGLSWGWWTAIGGQGNPVVGATDRTAGTVLEWLIPLVFIVLLIPALPLFAEREEEIFRLGSEDRTLRQRAWWGVKFGMAHALIGIPIGAALGLSVGGWYFTWAYLRGYRAGGQVAAVAESTRSHLAYNLIIVTLVLVAIALGGV